MPTSETLMDDGEKPLRRKVAGCNRFAAFRSIVYAKTEVFDNTRRKEYPGTRPKNAKNTGNPHSCHIRSTQGRRE